MPTLQSEQVVETLSSIAFREDGTSYSPSPAQHIHNPLPTGRWFRLLCLLPGNFQDPICCELIASELEKAPPYEPLSYCWGNPTDRMRIKCNALDFTITANLFKALRRFRQRGEPRMLWTDGICIDQTSMEERANQVALMDQVYAREMHVDLAWGMRG